MEEEEEAVSRGEASRRPTTHSVPGSDHLQTIYFICGFFGRLAVVELQKRSLECGVSGCSQTRHPPQVLGGTEQWLCGYRLGVFITKYNFKQDPAPLPPWPLQLFIGSGRQPPNILLYLPKLNSDRISKSMASESRRELTMGDFLGSDMSFPWKRCHPGRAGVWFGLGGMRLSIQLDQWSGTKTITLQAPGTLQEKGEDWARVGVPGKTKGEQSQEERWMDTKWWPTCRKGRWPHADLFDPAAGIS